MLRTTWIAILLGFWSSLYLVDTFIKSSKRCGQQYVEAQERYGIQVSIGQVRWYTTCFNRLFLRLGQWKPRLIQMWFRMGAFVGVLLMFASVGLLVSTLVEASSKESPEQVLTPVMPGVNLPLRQITYFFSVLLISAVWHELGHAIAAVREQVRVNGFGMFIMAIYPGAFVDLHSDHLQAISPARQLRIYCAGIWHNLVLVALGIFVFYALPYLLSPLYITGAGVIITDVLKYSPVSGHRGLSAGSHVTSINGCPVYDTSDWSKCLGSAVFYPQPGFCMQLGKVQQYSKDVPLYRGYGGQIECCRNDSVSELCFFYEMGSEVGAPQKHYACLEARPLTDLPRCFKGSDCVQTRKTACLQPSLDNSSRLLRVYLTTGKPVLYVGDTYLFGYSLSVTNYIPRYRFLPLSLPDVIELFCKYLISFSGALAILNAIPCYALDGQYILKAFMEHTLASRISSTSDRNLIYSLILLFGTLLLGANLVLALFALVFSA
ncbi:membrane-bound transcription factor site-2 protease-like isoform X2 [Asterias amurensis]|uniref:membrane-bound transcription factor site-2 protease-like isoform X2 n=1 Tax=Asterias amurensis TaxID=7602 RepID=UPI003AB2313D